MESYQERLLVERNTVEQNAKKLEEFIYENPIFQKLDKELQVLAIQQLTFMEGYYKTLDKRIKLGGIA